MSESIVDLFRWIDRAETSSTLEVTEDIREVTLVTEHTDPDAVDLDTLLDYVLSQPSLIGGRSPLLIVDEGNLLNITSSAVRINDELFEELDQEFPESVALFEYQRSIQNNSDNPAELIPVLIELLQLLSHRGHTFSFKTILSKSEIGQAMFKGIERYDMGDLNPVFWYDLTNLVDWIQENPLASYANQFFKEHKQLVFIYQTTPEPELVEDLMPGEQDAQDILIPFLHLSDVAGTIFPQSGIKSYRDSMKQTSSITEFRNDLVLSPQLFINSTTLREWFAKPLTYGLFAAFADRVSDGPSSGTIKFEINRGQDRTATTLDFSGPNPPLSDEKIPEMIGLYQEFNRVASSKTFVGLWRRSIAAVCSDKMDEIPDSNDEIREQFQFLEREIVDSKFEDLSTAVRDTQALMTDVTRQVSNTASDMSKELQRLIITLLGAALTNLFIIIRRSEDPELVSSFSALILVGFVSLYLPIVDERIESLDELQRKSEEDYRAYQKTLGKYSTGTLGIDDLEGRKNEYLGYAGSTIQSAIKKIWTIHLFLMIASFLIISYTTLIFPAESIPVFMSGILLAMIIYQVHAQRCTDSTHYYYRIGLSITVPPDKWYTRNENEVHPNSLGRRNPIPIWVGGLGLLLLLMNIAGYLPLTT